MLISSGSDSAFVSCRNRTCTSPGTICVPLWYAVYNEEAVYPRHADRASRTFRLAPGEWCLVVLTSPAGFVLGFSVHVPPRLFRAEGTVLCQPRVERRAFLQSSRNPGFEVQQQAKSPNGVAVTNAPVFTSSIPNVPVTNPDRKIGS